MALMLPTSRAFFAFRTQEFCWRARFPMPIYLPFFAPIASRSMRRGSRRFLKKCEVCLLLTFRQAEAVARLLKPRVPSLTEVADAEKPDRGCR